MSSRPIEDVVLLFGGDGSEHRVSVASAQNVASLIERASLWFVSRRGAVRHVRREELLSFEKPFETDFEAAPVEGWPSLSRALEAAARGPRGEGVVFFLAVHGGSGEDGTLQALLEERRLAFTGSGAAASRLAFDKHRAKETVRAQGINVAEAVLVTADAASHERLGRLFELHERLVIKPLTDGSSHGVHIVANERELSRAIEAVVADRRPYLAEVFVSGRELTVGTIEAEGGLEALPCSEVRLDEGRTFDFEGKYLGRGTREITPAEISEEESDAAKAVALAAHRALGCSGYARTDVISTKEGPVFLETNTLPGLTKASFIPQQLEAAGIPMVDFLERQLTLARERRETY